MAQPNPDYLISVNEPTEMTAAQDYAGLALESANDHSEIEARVVPITAAPSAAEHGLRDDLVTPIELTTPETDEKLGELEANVSRLTAELVMLASKYEIATDESGLPVVGDNHRWVSAKGASVPLDHYAFIDGGPLESDLNDAQRALAAHRKSQTKTADQQSA